MHLLTRFRRVRPPGRSALGLFDPADGSFRVVLELPEGAERCDGLLGLALGDRALFVSASPFRHRGEEEPTLLAFRPGDLMPEARYRLKGLADVRSLWFWDGSLYVASGGTGEVVAFRTIGPRLIDDRFLWRPRLAVEGLADPELTAIRALGNELYAAAIDRGTGQGLLFNVTRDAVAARGLEDPQSLAAVGVGCACIASGLGEVQRLDSSFRPVRSASIGDLARGLVFADGRLYAASTTKGRAAIHRLDPDDLTIERSFPIDIEGAEVADLLPIEGAGAWPSPPESLWHQTHGEPL